MTIDPDGCTFWYTGEYYDAHPTTKADDNWLTRIGVVPAAELQLADVARRRRSAASGRRSGPVGTSVTITGTNLTGATAVKFNGTSGDVLVEHRHAGGRDRAERRDERADQRNERERHGDERGELHRHVDASAAGRAVDLEPDAVGRPGRHGGHDRRIGLTGATRVSFNGKLASFSVDGTGTHVSTKVPNGAKTGPVTVTTPSGTSNSLTFTVTR